MAVLIRHAEELEGGLDRQLDRHLAEEVETLLVGHRVQDGHGAGPQLCLHVGHGAGGDRRGHQLADPVVAWVVHHVEQDPGAEPVGEILDDGASPSWPGARSDEKVDASETAVSTSA